MEKRKSYDRVFRALGDSHRLRILDLLMAEQELNAGQILGAVDVVQSTLSHHMKTLTQAGLVTVRKDGKWTCYRVNEQAVQEAREYLLRYLSQEEMTGEPAGDGRKEPARVSEELPKARTKPQQIAGETAREKPLRQETEPLAQVMSEAVSEVAAEDVFTESTSPEGAGEGDRRKLPEQKAKEQEPKEQEPAQPVISGKEKKSGKKKEKSGKSKDKENKKKKKK